MNSSTTSTDPFHILCIEPGASEKEIKAAFRLMAKKYHPDLNKDDDAPRKFRMVQEAYQRIQDGYQPPKAGKTWSSASGTYKVYEILNENALNPVIIRSEPSFPAGTVVHIARGGRTFKFKLDERKRLPFDVRVGGMQLKFRNPPEGFDPRY